MYRILNNFRFYPWRDEKGKEEIGLITCAEKYLLLTGGQKELSTLNIGMWEKEIGGETIIKTYFIKCFCKHHLVGTSVTKDM